MGWAQQVRPFGGDDVRPLGLSLLLTALLLGVAGFLVNCRDLGRGLAPEHPGHDRAAPGLLSLTGLAWRLQRGVWLAWGLALGLFGLILGSLSEQIRTRHQARTAEWYTRTGGSHVILDAYRTSIIEMAGMFVAVYVVQVLLRLQQRRGGRDPGALLATHVSRLAMAQPAALVNAASGATGLMLLFGDLHEPERLTFWVTRPTQMVVLSTAALAQLPGVLVLGAVVVAAVGLLPRAAVPASWLLLVAALALGPMFGPGLGLPPWLLGLSPFTHLPKAPANPIAVTPLVLVTARWCVGLVGMGLVALRRRDLALPA